MWPVPKEDFNRDFSPLKWGSLKSASVTDVTQIQGLYGLKVGVKGLKVGFMSRFGLQISRLLEFVTLENLLFDFQLEYSRRGL